MVRLNDMTCAGCHSGRSVNGFHFLGEERPNSTHPLNALFMGFSEYSRTAQIHRMEILKARAQKLPTDVFVLPISIKPLPTGALYGSTCALPQAAKVGGHFPGWNCASGLTCRQTDEPESEKDLGKCYPERSGFSGDPCNFGFTIENSDPTKESLRVTEVSTCSGISACSNLGGGFPGGMCRRSCSEINQGGQVEACGPIASNGFNECLDDPNKTFVDCLENNSDKNGRSRCNLESPCRQDYFCARALDSTSYGACVPGYFFFQLGMDAHPILSLSEATISLGFKGTTESENQMKASARAGGGLVLKRKPISSSALLESEMCVLPKEASVAILRRKMAVNGHIPVEVQNPPADSACKDFGGLIYVFQDHVEFF